MRSEWKEAMMVRNEWGVSGEWEVVWEVSGKRVDSKWRINITWGGNEN